MFDEKRLINDVIKQLNIEMDIVAKILITFMIGELDELRINPNNPSMNDWKAEVIEALNFRSVASAGSILKEVGILQQNNMGLMDMALSLEFGTGKLAKTSENPWFGEFLASEYYHTSRDGMEITTLPGEMVFEPESNSWKESNATTPKPMNFLAQEGAMYWSNIFGNSAIMAQTYFNRGIDKAIESIDFSNYLIVK